MKITKETTTKTVEQELLVNKYICYQKFVNDKLVDQYFKTKKPEKSHPFAYNPKSMQFRYYGSEYLKSIKDINIDIQEDLDSNSYYETLWPNPIFVDLETFSDYKNLFCPHFQMDGYLYKLTSKTPVSVLKFMSFNESDFYLEKVKEHLDTLPWVHGAKIEDTPYYNVEICGRHELHVKYKLPQNLLDSITTTSYGCWEFDSILRSEKVMNVERFRRESTNYNEDDEDEY